MPPRRLPSSSFSCLTAAGLVPPFSTQTLPSYFPMYLQCPPNVRRVRRTTTPRLLLCTHAQHWSLLFRLLQLSLLLKLLVACSRGGQHGYYHGNRRLLVPLTSVLQMAPETLLYHLGLNDRRLPGGPQAARSVRTPGDPARRRQLLRL